MRKNCLFDRFSVSDSLRFLFNAVASKLVAFPVVELQFDESLTSISGEFAHDIEELLVGDDMYDVVYCVFEFSNKEQQMFWSYYLEV